MAKIYNGRFNVPKEPEAGTLWLVLGIGLIVFGSMPGLVLGVLSLSKYGKCRKERKLYERFFEYCAVIGMRSRVPVRELARCRETSKGDVRKDLQSMIAKGYFGEDAYLDAEGGALVLPGGVDGVKAGGNWKDAVLELIHDLRAEFGTKEKTVEAQPRQTAAEPEPEPEPQPAAKPEPPKSAGLSYMEELERTLNELYQLNAQIRDEAVSQRIDTIGQLTGGIFRVVIEKPEREGDVRKFMNYYLPTTLKLLKSYEMMESQSYQGENILASRKKIEGVLDMLIEAYQKQLDRLFRDDALDIATDIDVLETMIAGDGLSSKGRLKL